MKCVICKQGETRPGAATVTLEREATILIVKSVPRKCVRTVVRNTLNEDITAKLLQEAEEAVKAGVHMTTRTYAAA